MGLRDVVGNLLEQTHARLTERKHQLSEQACDAADQVGRWSCHKLLRELESDGVDFPNGHKAALDQQIATYQSAMNTQKVSIREICRRTGVSRATVNKMFSRPSLRAKVLPIANVAAALELPLFSTECRGYGEDCSPDKVDRTDKLDVADDEPASKPAASAPVPSEVPQPADRGRGSQDESEVERLRKEVAELKRILAERQKTADSDDNPSSLPRADQASSSNIQADAPGDGQKKPQEDSSQHFEPETGASCSTPEAESEGAGAEEQPQETPAEPINPEVLPPRQDFYIPKTNHSSYFKMSMENRRLQRELDRSRQQVLELEGAVLQANRNGVAGSVGVFAGSFATMVVHDLYGYTSKSAIGNSVAGLLCIGVGQLLSAAYPAAGTGLRQAGVGMLVTDGATRLYRFMRSRGAGSSAQATSRSSDTFPSPAHNPLFWQVAPSKAWWKGEFTRAKKVDLLRAPTDVGTDLAEAMPDAGSEDRDVVGAVGARSETTDHRAVGTESSDDEVASYPAANPSPASPLPMQELAAPLDSVKQNTETIVQQPVGLSFLERCVLEYRSRRAECEPRDEIVLERVLGRILRPLVEACVWQVEESCGSRNAGDACRSPQPRHRSLFELLMPTVPAQAPASYLCPFDEWAPETDPPARREVSLPEHSGA